MTIPDDDDVLLEPSLLAHLLCWQTGFIQKNERAVWLCFFWMSLLHTLALSVGCNFKVFEQIKSAVGLYIHCKMYFIEAWQCHIRLHQINVAPIRFPILVIMYHVSLGPVSSSPLLKPLLFHFSLGEKWQEGDIHLIKGIGVSNFFFLYWIKKWQKRNLPSIPISLQFNFHPKFRTIVPQNCWNWMLKYLCFSNLSASGWRVKR